MRRHPFIWKSFVSFLVLLSFVALALTGSVLYIAPAGRIANWSSWTFGALQKEDWQAIHTVIATLFLVGGVVHLILNWPVLRAYLRMRLASGARRHRELLAAVGLAAGLVAISIGDLPPAAQVMDWGEAIKTSWGTNGNEPPVPHAELLSVAKLAELRQTPVNTFIEQLGRNGISATPESTLAQLAVAGEVAPSQVYQQMTAGLETSSHVAAVSGSGYGRKSVEELAAQLNVPVGVALERLRLHGVSAEADSNVRAVAIAHGKLPADLAALITAQ